MQQRRARSPMTDDEQRRRPQARPGHASTVPGVLDDAQDRMHDADEGDDGCDIQVAEVDGEVIAEQQAHPGEQVAALPEARRPLGRRNSWLAGGAGHGWRFSEWESGRAGSGLMGNLLFPLAFQGRLHRVCCKCSDCHPGDHFNGSRRGAVVARQAHNLEVTGSNPVAATSLRARKATRLPSPEHSPSGSDTFHVFCVIPARVVV